MDQHSPARFADWLADEQAYSPRSVREKVEGLRRAEAWLAEHGLARVKDADEEDVLRYLESEIRNTYSARGAVRKVLYAYWRFVGRSEYPVIQVPPRSGKMSRDRRVSFRLSLEQRGYADSTIRNYTRMVARIERWLADHGCPRLAQADWQEIGEFAETTPYTYASRNMVRNAIRTYWTTYLGREKDPSWAVRTPKEPRMRCRALEPEELDRVLAAARECGDPRIWAAVALMYFAALRRAEVASLRWDDLDDEGWMHLVGKGQQEAFLPVHSEIREALDRLEPKPDSPYVFPSRFPGTHITPATVNLWVRMIAETADVRLSPHMLRHTSLTDANDKTRDLRAVQSFARHAKPETTAGYTRTSKERLLEVLASLDRDEDPPPPLRPVEDLGNEEEAL